MMKGDDIMQSKKVHKHKGKDDKMGCYNVE